MYTWRSFEHYEIEKYLRSSTILGGVGVRVLEGISCFKCIICIISLVIKQNFGVKDFINYG